MHVVVLPGHVSASRVADGAREAVLALVRGAGHGWEKRELAEWLAGPYCALTSYAAADPPPPSKVRGAPASERARAPESGAKLRRREPLSVTKVHDVMGAAKEELLATLLMAAPPNSDVTFAQRAVARGQVLRARDAAGRGGWVPVDAPGMRLTERITSLLSVDYLMRPADYLALLSVCGRCRAVSFDAQVRVRARARGDCALDRRSSAKIRISV